MRRLRTEDWTWGQETRFLYLVGANFPDSPHIPSDAKAYLVFGLIVYQVYAEPLPKYWRGSHSIPREWRAAWVGRKARNLP